MLKNALHTKNLSSLNKQIHHKPTKARLMMKLLWDSSSLGTYVKKRHGELK